MISLVSAVPPVTQIAQSGSLDIAYPQYQYVQQDKGFILNIHVYNTSDYITGGTGTCFLDLYNAIGNETLSNQLTGGASDYYIPISSGNFSMLGYTSFIIECNTTSQTGFANGIFEVTYNGKAPPEQNIIILYSLFIIALVVLLLTSLLSIIYNLINWSLDGKDMTFAVSVYFGLFMTYILATTYLGNQFIEELLLLFIEVGALIHVIVPIVGFFMYFFRSNLEKNRSNPNGA